MRSLRLVVLSCLCLAVATTAAAVDGPEIPNRLPQAKAGEWVLMQGTSGDNMGVRNRVTVTAVKDGVVSLKRERLAPDGTVEETNAFDLNLERMASRNADLREHATAINTETIFVKDKEFSVVAVSWKGDPAEDGSGEREFKIWLSPDLPVGGLAKTWSSDHDFPSSEIVDYGF
ncbi:MAG: hypothetical protein LUG50_09150 [Planctomycetaceae bacterium]|nr:hypothetical protein [Planctomycetaceae bacterium]